ncbi:hypothetical protein BDY24DRAFT_115077 [Mrakia frigida]|uniref:uncharacterized protein n=1 Tax=Mrakia frigida TaxID=29902 RepID=UPI003FCC0F1A
MVVGRRLTSTTTSLFISLVSSRPFLSFPSASIHHPRFNQQQEPCPSSSPPPPKQLAHSSSPPLLQQQPPPPPPPLAPPLLPSSEPTTDPSTSTLPSLLSERTNDVSACISVFLVFCGLERGLYALQEKKGGRRGRNTEKGEIGELTSFVFPFEWFFFHRRKAWS